MRIEVLCFAAARDAIGAMRTEIDIEPGTTVGSALVALVTRYPALESLVPSLRVALNEEFVATSVSVPEGATLALLPPVSGG